MLEPLEHHLEAMVEVTVHLVPHSEHFVYFALAEWLKFVLLVHPRKLRNPVSLHQFLRFPVLVFNLFEEGFDLESHRVHLS